MDNDSDSLTLSQLEEAVKEPSSKLLSILQPSSAPYNITEKVQQANEFLFSSQLNQNPEKIAKVKFREELISFEPSDLTDDDVNSIENDHTELLPIDPLPTISECKPSISTENLTISNVEEDIEVLELLEEVSEEVENDLEFGHEIKVNTFDEKTVGVETSVSSSKRGSDKRSKMSKSQSAFFNPHEVNCKDHCIDKLDRDLSMSIGKLDIREKLSLPLPPLHLLQRKCCDEVKKKLHQNLPDYNGSRSEYGLSSGQLQKREKQTELFKMRQHTRRRLADEYRHRKMQQNEEVFCQWLRGVSRRKSEKRSFKQRGVASANSQFRGVSKTDHKVVERPKTVNTSNRNAMTRNNKQRPQSTKARVYIEVPSGCFQKHLRFGELIIANSKLFSKNIHIVTIS